MADPIRVTQRGSAQVQALTGGWFRLSMMLFGSALVLMVGPRWVASFEREIAAHPIAAMDFLSEPAPAQFLPVAASMPRTPQPRTEPAVHPTQAALADFLAKRYRVSRYVVADFVSHAYAAGQKTQIDPLLILAVMAVESSFNPIAESGMGAKGLMQVIPKFHPEKFVPRGGRVDVLDPATNILAGAKVLREYAARAGDDLAEALRLYGGVPRHVENAYARKVLAERRRLEQVLGGQRSRGNAAQPASAAPRETRL